MSSHRLSLLAPLAATLALAAPASAQPLAHIDGIGLGARPAVAQHFAASTGPRALRLHAHSRHAASHRARSRRGASAQRPR